MPLRIATDEYLALNGIELEVVFDFDVGEVAPGRRLLLRGLNRTRSTEDELHFEYVPGRTSNSPAPDWVLDVRDDLETKYSRDEFGAEDGRSGGESTHGFRRLGG